MQPFEELFLMACCAPLLSRLIFPDSASPVWTLMPIGLLLLGSMLTGGARWAMIPAYLSASLVLSLFVLRIAHDSRLVPICVWTGLLLACTVGLRLELGRGDAPRPSGPYSVGVLRDVAADGGPPAGPGSSGRAVLSIWYPGDGSAATGELPPLPATPAGFPVLIDMPSWGGDLIDNEVLVRELVSHGFVVVTLQYPPAPFDQERETPSHRQNLLRRPMDFSSEGAFDDTLRRATEMTVGRARDAGHAVDRLEALNRSDPARRFTGRLDLGSVGIFGFSLGGAVAAQACWMDPRFRAAVNMDGWHFAEAAHQGVRQPYLLLSDDTPLPSAADQRSSDPVLRYSSILTDQDYRGALNHMQKFGGIYVRLAGSRHLNFTDGVRRIPFWRDGGVGSIKPSRALTIINAYVVAFFERYLAGKQSPLLAGDSRSMPEAHVQVWTSGAAPSPIDSGKVAVAR